MEAIFPKTALKISIWVFFIGLKSESGYFLGFSKKISDEHTYHLYIKSAPPGQNTFDSFGVKTGVIPASVPDYRSFIRLTNVKK